MENLDYSKIDFTNKKFEDQTNASEIRDRGYLTHQDLINIADNKSGGRTKKTVRESQYNRENVEELSKEAFKILEEHRVEPAMSYLTLLDGIRARTASAILTAYSEDYGMIDRKAVENLQERGILEDIEFTNDRDWIRFYPLYLDKLQKILDQNPEFESVRDIEFALYSEK